MTVSRYTLKNGKARWRAAANVGDRQLKKQGFRTREEAENWRAGARKELRAAPLYNPNITMAELSELWVEFKTARTKPATMVDYDKQLRLRILPAFRDRKITSLSPLELQAFLDGLPSPRLVNKTRVVLSSMFKMAAAWGLIASDPTRPLHGMKEPKREMRVLTTEEAQRLLRRLEGQYRLLALVALHTGARIGELLALTYEDVTPNRMSINKTYARGRTDTPKTSKSRRDIVICDEIYRAVHLHGQARGDLPGALVFRRKDGRPLEVWNFADRLNTAAKRAGLGHVRPHDLRHTYASWALAGGVSPKMVSEQLGHSAISITMDLYAHVMKVERDGFENYLKTQVGNFSESVIEDIQDQPEGNVLKLPARKGGARGGSRTRTG